MLIPCHMNELAAGESFVVRMLRLWASCRSIGEPPLPRLAALGIELGSTACTAVAVDSLFQLTEACLGRGLESECCCSTALGSDERALLYLIVSAVPPGSTPAPLPGLPGALRWAAFAARRQISEDIGWMAPGAGPRFVDRLAEMRAAG